MEPASEVSSLYGYGAFICWLCTILSVVISWTFNRHGMRHDTIGNDFVATLMMPCIAFVQIVIELDKMRRNSLEVLPNADVVRAARYILLWFTAFAPGLFLISMTSTGWKRKSCCGIVAGLAGLLSAATSKVEKSQVDPELIVILLFLPVVPLMYVLLHLIDRTCIPSLSKSASYLEWLLLTIIAGISIGGLAANAKTAFDWHSDESRSIAQCAPSAKYSLAELDQAVALATGIVTVVCSLYESCKSHTISGWERYEAWKFQCEEHIERGCLDAAETTKWKEELCKIQSRADEVLRAPGSTPYLDDIRRYHEKKVAKGLRASGLL